MWELGRRNSYRGLRFFAPLRMTSQGPASPTARLSIPVLYLYKRRFRPFRFTPEQKIIPNTAKDLIRQTAVNEILRHCVPRDDCFLFRFIAKKRHRGPVTARRPCCPPALSGPARSQCPRGWGSGGPSFQSPPGASRPLRCRPHAAPGRIRCAGRRGRFSCSS